jgi:hypothetical protein
MHEVRVDDGEPDGLRLDEHSEDRHLDHEHQDQDRIDDGETNLKMMSKNGAVGIFSHLYYLYMYVHNWWQVHLLVIVVSIFSNYTYND